MGGYNRHVERTVEWSTSAALFTKLDAEFGPFTLDVAASILNSKCEKFFTRADDGLSQPWTGERVWCNPPYGTEEIPRWIEKARRESRAGALVVMLLPARTDTAWWHREILAHEVEVRFLRGRVQFQRAGAEHPTPAAFASAIIIFRPQERARLTG